MTYKETLEKFVEDMNFMFGHLDHEIKKVEIRPIEVNDYVGIGLFIDDQLRANMILDQKKMNQEPDYVYYKMIDHLCHHGVLWLHKLGREPLNFPCLISGYNEDKKGENTV